MEIEDLNGNIQLDDILSPMDEVLINYKISNHNHNLESSKCSKIDKHDEIKGLDDAWESLEMSLCRSLYSKSKKDNKLADNSFYTYQEILNLNNPNNNIINNKNANGNSFLFDSSKYSITNSYEKIKNTKPLNKPTPNKFIPQKVNLKGLIHENDNEFENFIQKKIFEFEQLKKQIDPQQIYSKREVPLESNRVEYIQNNINDLPDYDQLSSLHRGIKLEKKTEEESLIKNRNKAFKSFLHPDNQTNDRKDRKKIKQRNTETYDSSSRSSKELFSYPARTEENFHSKSILREKYNDVISYLNSDNNMNIDVNDDTLLIQQHSKHNPHEEEEEKEKIVDPLEDVLKEYRKKKIEKEEKRRMNQRPNSIQSRIIHNTIHFKDKKDTYHSFIDYSSNKAQTFHSSKINSNPFHNYEFMMNSSKSQERTLPSRVRPSESTGSIEASYDPEFKKTLNYVKKKYTDKHQYKINSDSRINWQIQNKFDSNKNLLRSLFK